MHENNIGKTFHIGSCYLKQKNDIKFLQLSFKCNINNIHNTD